ncbi:sensor histidine kinase [Sporosalibacterium faouarense]|uniref:sensor histidine kinase n=1 Tax=Sporosalibacterium faouarense TaxID=516123 RepID=UPI00192BAE7F|nr:Spo0B domain-containing protein [Sporosalibacterium faouarense]
MKKVTKQLNVNKTVGTLILINAIQIAVLFAIIIYAYFIIDRSNLEIDSNINLVISVVLIIIIFNSIRSIKDIYLLSNMRSKNNVLEKTVHEIESLNKRLRGQRHDFLNHLQVVHGLIEMDEYNEAREYIQEIYKDINKVSRILKTSNVAINALLQAKIQECENSGVQVTLKISSHLEELRIPSWEMCRVLGNLIDNAIYALDHTEDKKITIEIYEEMLGYVFRIVNTGESIPVELQEKIFDAGFTTKGNEGEGMGLAIVKEVVSEYDGKIGLESDDHWTSFTITIPY